MTLILDSSIVIDLERGDRSTIESIEKIKKLHPGPPLITFITYFELFEGMLKRKIKNKESFLEFLNKLIYLHLTKKTAEILAELKINYENKGIKLSLADFLIASQTKENNFTLVTKDNHFKHIEEIEKIIL